MKKWINCLIAHLNHNFQHPNFLTMARHYSVPATLTYENLADWIKDQAIGEPTIHVEKIKLDEDIIHELEAQSSLASRSIDRLEKVKKEFMDYLKEGTPSDIPAELGDDPQRQPISITIPPTKGLKALKANREYADKQIEDGFKEESIEVYLIPYPESSMIFGVTITGEEAANGQYNREMTIEEVNQHMPMLKVPKDKKKKKDKGQMDLMSEPVSESDLDL
jgi:hypothetical protein